MKKHQIFDENGCFYSEVEYKSKDPNLGLPDWYFQGYFIRFEIDKVADKVEWWPEIGPAPHWTAKLSQFSNDRSMFKAWKEWAHRNY